jgi:hypothetical protein
MTVSTASAKERPPAWPRLQFDNLLINHRQKLVLLGSQ